MIAATALGSLGPVVDTAYGRVQGVMDRRGVVAHRGIPFAAPPLGPRRFAPPLPPSPWGGTLRASSFRHNCMQGTMDMGWPQPLSTQSEDCLYLNVYTTADAIASNRSLPVLFWIFGL